MAQLVKNLPAMWEPWVRSLAWEDPLEEGKAYPLQYSGPENSMNCYSPWDCKESDTIEQLSLSLESGSPRSGCQQEEVSLPRS